jgi:hypothetical protein
VKNAGPRRFAILTNSVFQTLLPTYNHAYTTVFVRDLAQLASDTVCYRPKTPPLVNLFPQWQDTVPVGQAPNYINYNEPWTATPKIPYKPICGTNWKIFPGQAINAMVNPPDEIAPDDQATARQTFVSAAKAGGLLFPNPAESQVTITLNKEFAQASGPISISLLSAEMKRLRTENISYKTYHTLSLSRLLPGMYIIEVLQGDNKKLYRFVKE